jgi:hypothetical protein
VLSNWGASNTDPKLSLASCSVNLAQLSSSCLIVGARILSVPCLHLLMVMLKWPGRVSPMGTRAIEYVGWIGASIRFHFTSPNGIWGRHTSVSPHTREVENERGTCCWGP